MSDRLRELCDADLRTHTDADLDDDVSELQTLALRLVQDVRNKDKRISELEAKLELVRELPAMWRKSSFAAHRPACDFIEDICADELAEALADD